MSEALKSSDQLESLAERMNNSSLSEDDKAEIGGLLEQVIELRKLMEGAAETPDGKKVIASLPFGFDLVK